MKARTYLVVGGGIVGIASALRMQAAGFEVTLIDPGDPRRGASFGNVGNIATAEVAPLASPQTLLTFPWRLFAFGGPLAFARGEAKMWMPWALKFARACSSSRYAQGVLAMDGLQREAMAAWQRIFALANIPSLVTPCGHYAVWMEDQAAKDGVRAWRRAPTGPATFRDMTAGELAAVGAVLDKPPVAGLAFSGTGQVSEPQAVRDALRGAFVARGGIVVDDSVSALSTNAQEVTALLESGTSLKGDAALVSAGAWSRPLMKGLGIDVPLIGERGYSMQSAEHAWPVDLPPVFFEERAMVATRFTGGLRVSSFVEFGGPDAKPDPRKWERLAQHLRELGIKFSAEPDRWSGPRPTLPDYLPAIGRLDAHPRILYAFGHQHLGMTLAAVTAELIESLALWTSPRLGMAPFRAERFA